MKVNIKLLRKKYPLYLIAMDKKKYVIRLIDGKPIKYRVNPPRDAKGKVVPTAKQKKARAAASKRMKAAAVLLKKEYGSMIKPGTQAYGNAMREYLTKNLNEKTGKKKSRIVRKKAKLCRKGGKISSC